MKFKGTWVLALIAIALGLYVYLIEIKKAEKDEERKTAAEKVIDFDSAKVKSILLKNSKGEFAIEKGDGNTWRLTKPITDKADESNISGILSSLAAEKFDDTIEGEDLKNFGLDNPTETISVTTQDGVTKKLSVGSEAAIPGKVYLRRGDEKKVLYAASGVKVQLDKALKDLRDKQIFKKNKDDVTHISMKVNTKDNRGSVSLTKKDGDWILDGLDEKADPDVTTALLNGISGLNATDFPSEKASDKAEQKKYGLNVPALDLILDDKDKKLLGHLLVSPKKENNVYASVEGVPTVYQLFASAVDGLMKKPQDFRNKKIPLEFKKDDVADIFVKTSTAENHLVKKGSSWELFLPDEKRQVSQIQVASFLDKMSDLKVAEYVDTEKPIGLNPPLGHVVLKGTKGETLLDFSWGERAKIQRNDYARTSKYKGNFTVDNSSIQGIPIQTLVERKAVPAAKATPTPIPNPPASSPAGKPGK